MFKNFLIAILFVILLTSCVINLFLGLLLSTKQAENLSWQQKLKTSEMQLEGYRKLNEISEEETGKSLDDMVDEYEQKKGQVIVFFEVGTSEAVIKSCIENFTSGRLATLVEYTSSAQALIEYNRHLITQGLPTVNVKLPASASFKPTDTQSFQRLLEIEKSNCSITSIKSEN